MSRAIGLLLGFAADRAFGDPQRAHPVSGFGNLASAVERRLYADERAAGVRYTATLVGGAVILGVVLERRSRRPFLHTLSTAAATWAVLGGRSLERESQAVEGFLLQGDLPAARQRLTHLVGRETTSLDEREVARAVIESIAENTSDAVVAPLIWGAIGGIPGLLGYRAANTLDAMVGHRNPRYENFGWASARFDDLVNLPGSRLAGLLAVMTSGKPKQTWSAWRRDAADHPSPNAGVVEASFAGALGISLGGSNRYGDRVEDRARMGSGRSPETTDIATANHLARRIGYGAALTTTVLCRVVRTCGRHGLRN